MEKATDIIKKCLVKEGITQKRLAELMGEDARSINQQLNHSQDMKMKRFVDVMEHLGYSIVIKDDGKINKVSEAFLESNELPDGCYYTEKDGFIVGIYSLGGSAELEVFEDKEQCISWLQGKQMDE